MTKTDKYKLLTFITRPAMFIHPVDQNNITSFIHGYKWGKKQPSDFCDLIKTLLLEKYKVFHSSDGWPGQIKRLAAKRDENWATTFRWISLEILADEENGGWDNTMSEILKPRIFSLIERIQEKDVKWFDDKWIEDWLALCPVQSTWFQKIWEEQIWSIIKPVNKKMLLTLSATAGPVSKKLLKLKALLHS